MDSRRWVAAAAVVALLVACSTGAPGASPSALRAPASDNAFAGRTYSLNLPAGWISQGSPQYDGGVDRTPDVADWLDRLDLLGSNEFRAYEPKPGATGIRLAINPLSPWSPANPRIFEAESNIEALPGVREGSVESVWVDTGEAKGWGYRWVQAIDWGDGKVSARTCVGYLIMAEFDPVDVVFSYPADTERMADIEALMRTFRITGNTVWSPAPGLTLPPSPTPFDKFATPGPVPTYHAVPELEALLPDTVDGRALKKGSRTGVEMGMSTSDPILRTFGKEPAQYQYAEAYPVAPPVLIIGVTRIRGVPADQLLAAQLSRMPNVKASVTTLAGRQLTATVGGMFPVWYWATGELLYGVVAPDQDAAGRVFALLR